MNTQFLKQKISILFVIAIFLTPSMAFADAQDFKEVTYVYRSFISDVPADIQGRSLLPLLKGGESVAWRKSLYYAYYEIGEHAVPQHFGVRSETHKLIHFPQSDEWNLFDLQQDPHEMNSVYGTAEYQAVQQQLLAEFHRLREQYDAPPFDQNLSRIER